MSDDVPPPIGPQIAQARQIIERCLGERIAGIHLYGSAVDGGLHPYSDIDLLVTVSEAPPDATRRALMEALLVVSAPPGTSPSLRALEVTVLALEHVVPWRHPARRELQFGEWLRDDLLAGVVEAPAADPDLAILLTQARASSIAITGPGAQTLFDAVPRADLMSALLDTVAQWNGPEDWAGDERNIILALARSWYTATHGEITSKQAAAAWLMERIGLPHRTVLAKARACYLGEEQDQLTSHGAEVAAFVAYARKEVRQLCSSAR